MEYLLHSITVPGLSTSLTAVLVILVAAGTYRLMKIGSRDPRMPSGPPTVPILGNLHQIPSSGLYSQ
jgi:hypothetical protein